MSAVVNRPTPSDVRFQNASAIGSSLPVARSTADIATQATRPSGKPVGKLWPLPPLVTETVRGAVPPGFAVTGPDTFRIQHVEQTIPRQASLLRRGVTVADVVRIRIRVDAAFVRGRKAERRKLRIVVHASCLVEVGANQGQGRRALPPTKWWLK